MIFVNRIHKEAPIKFEGPFILTPFFQSLSSSHDSFELIGIDEVGRGPLAGPVVVCSTRVSFQSKADYESFINEMNELGVTDSKKLSQKKRLQILSKLNIPYSFESFDDHKKEEQIFNISVQYKKFLIEGTCCILSAFEIDQLNIFNATMKAMEICFEAQRPLVKKISWATLIDGPFIPKTLKDKYSKDQKNWVFGVVKGDLRSHVIALASIWAKEVRDFIMDDLALKYPGYDFEKNKGYPTAFHKEALFKRGITPCHRQSFKTCQEVHQA